MHDKIQNCRRQQVTKVVTHATCRGLIEQYRIVMIHHPLCLNGAEGFYMNYPLTNRQTAALAAKHSNKEET